MPSSNASDVAQTTKASDSPGCEPNIKETIIGRTESLVQNFAPVKQIHQHVCGFHGYAHDMTRQVRAEHYCSHVNAELRQCVIYDSDKKDARLIGIEYIISRRLFETLPEEEKCMWHSHRFEVMGGSLVAPEIPELVERVEMKSLVDTYGKTFHMWQFDRGDTLPLGPPQLMMSFTQAGQLDPELAQIRDEDCGIDSSTRAKARQQNINPPDQLAAGCDMWETGKAKQATLEDVDVKMPT